MPFLAQSVQGVGPAGAPMGPHCQQNKPALPPVVFSRSGVSLRHLQVSSSITVKNPAKVPLWSWTDPGHRGGRKIRGRACRHLNHVRAETMSSLNPISPRTDSWHQPSVIVNIDQIQELQPMFKGENLSC